MTTPQAIQQINLWKQDNQKIVLASGVFDILHIEHMRFLSKAKAQGNKLVVGIEVDARVKDVKGRLRPVNSQDVRLEQLESLKSVDLAFLLPGKFNTQEDWDQFMEDLKPDIYAVSSHSPFLENKKKLCDKCGIEFKIVHDFNPDYSTSIIFDKLSQEL